MERPETRAPSPRGSSQHSRSASGASARIALGYAVVASAWIVLSDLIVSALGWEMLRVQVLKGLFFVVVTSGGLYLLSRRQFTFRERRERDYQALFENNPNPMWFYDLETLRFLAVNDAAVARYGYSRDEFLGISITDIRPQEEVPALLEKVGNASEGFGDSGVWRHVTKDGTVVSVEVTSFVTEFAGRKAKLVLVKDVTEQRKAEEAVRQAKEELEAVLRTAPLAVVVLDKDRLVRYWNPRAEELFGWRAEEVLGRPTPLVPPGLEAEYEEQTSAVMRGEVVSGLEGRRIRKDGSVVDVVLYTAPLRDGEGEVTGAVGFTVDVTARKRTEEELDVYRTRLEEMVHERTAELEAANAALQRATRVKSEFLANMSHELRTPLNAVIGFSDLLLRGLVGDVTEEQRYQIDMINRAGRHLLELINEVLDLSRIEAGRATVVPEEFDLSEMVMEVVEMLRAQALEKGLQLECVCAGELPVRTDKVKAKQIVANLIGNAVKYTEEGVVSVRVTVEDDCAVVAVTDTGPGIPPDEKEAVFDEFRQLARRDARRPEGTGLGLTISRKYARLLGGEIHVESDVGRGSTFTLTLPLECPMTDSPAEGEVR